MDWIVFVLVGLLGYCAWRSLRREWAAKSALQQRKLILRCIRGTHYPHPQCQLLNAYNEVNYIDHVTALLRDQDPLELYDVPLATLVRLARGQVRV